MYQRGVAIDASGSIVLGALALVSAFVLARLLRGMHAAA
jgi:hypothetical protein